MTSDIFSHGFIEAMSRYTAYGGGVGDVGRETWTGCE